MKKITFVLPRKANATHKDDLKTILERAMKVNYPFLSTSSKVDYDNDEDEDEPEKVRVYTASLLNKVNDETSLFYLPRKYRYGGDNEEASQTAHKVELYNEFLKIMNGYEKGYVGGVKKTKSKDYDFINVLGEPVKIHQNFIQVGYTLIPRNDYSAIKKNKHAKEIERIMSRIIDIVNATR